MDPAGQFASRVLETSAAGYAGLSASLLVERHPELAGRYGPDAFGGWKAQLQQWLLDLSAAVAAGEPRLFAARMQWTRRAFEARRSPVEDLLAALEALRDTLLERMPAASADAVVAIVDAALQAASAPSADAGADSPVAAGRPAMAYLETILQGRPREAIDRLLETVDGGTPVREIYLDVLLAAQREAGRMWHDGALSIAEEHLITTTTQRAMTLLCERGRPAKPGNRTALLACVAGNVHDVGLRAIADFFEMQGWRSINLGPDVPPEEIARSVQIFDADVVVLAATLDPHLVAVQRAIERLRGLEDHAVRVIVGGPAFQRVPDLWKKLGADGHAPGVADAEPLAARLTGS